MGTSAGIYAAELQSSGREAYQTVCGYSGYLRGADAGGDGGTGDRRGRLDAVAIGRQFICDGEYLTKLKEGREEDIRPCISCHNGCLPIAYYKNSGAAADLSSPNSQGHCALNPVSFEEKI